MAKLGDGIIRWLGGGRKEQGFLPDFADQFIQCAARLRLRLNGMGRSRRLGHAPIHPAHAGDPGRLRTALLDPVVCGLPVDCQHAIVDRKLHAGRRMEQSRRPLEHDGIIAGKITAEIKRRLDLTEIRSV